MAQRDTDYNGWTNYATWRINLEHFDRDWSDDVANCRADTLDELMDELAAMMQNEIDEMMFDCSNEIVADYARQFVQDVNYREIAELIVEDYREDWPVAVQDEQAGSVEGADNA